MIANIKITLIFMLILITVNCGSFQETAKNEGTGSSGGDPLLTIFHRGRQLAIKDLNSYNSQSTNDQVSKNILKWILKNKDLLKKDIESSPHIWIKEEQFTCATTKNEANAPLMLSLPTCRKFNFTPQYAEEIIIHESVHHLGIVDETFVNNVAIAISNKNFSQVGTSIKKPVQNSESIDQEENSTISEEVKTTEETEEINKDTITEERYQEIDYSAKGFDIKDNIGICYYRPITMKRDLPIGSAKERCSITAKIYQWNGLNREVINHKIVRSVNSILLTTDIPKVEGDFKAIIDCPSLDFEITILKKNCDYSQ